NPVALNQPFRLANGKTRSGNMLAIRLPSVGCFPMEAHLPLPQTPPLLFPAPSLAHVRINGPQLEATPRRCGSRPSQPPQSTAASLKQFYLQAGIRITACFTPGIMYLRFRQAWILGKGSLMQSTPTRPKSEASP